MTDDQQKAIWDFVERGGGFLAVHNAHTMYPPNGPYYKLFGGDFGGHPKPCTFTIRVENKKHPITAGVEDFDIFDEQHMSKYFLDQDHLLLRSVARDNQQAAAGWWQEVGKGRFCYLSPGHATGGTESSHGAALDPECSPVGTADRVTSRTIDLVATSHVHPSITPLLRLSHGSRSWPVSDCKLHSSPLGQHRIAPRIRKK